MTDGRLCSARANNFSSPILITAQLNNSHENSTSSTAMVGDVFFVHSCPWVLFTLIPFPAHAVFFPLSRFAPSNSIFHFENKAILTPGTYFFTAVPRVPRYRFFNFSILHFQTPLKFIISCVFFLSAVTVCHSKKVSVRTVFFFKKSLFLLQDVSRCDTMQSRNDWKGMYSVLNTEKNRIGKTSLTLVEQCNGG